MTMTRGSQKEPQCQLLRLPVSLFSREVVLDRDCIGPNPSKALNFFGQGEFIGSVRDYS